MRKTVIFVVFLLLTAARVRAQVSGGNPPVGAAGIANATITDAKISGVIQPAHLPSTATYSDKDNAFSVGQTISATSFSVGGSTNTSGRLVANSTGTFIYGQTDGNQVPSSYIGYSTSIFLSATVTPNASGTFVALATYTLTPGLWNVYGSGDLDTGATTAATLLSFAISTSNTGADSPIFRCVNGSIPAVNSVVQCATVMRHFNVTANTTIYLTAYFVYSVLGGAIYSKDNTGMIIQRVH